MCGIAGVLVRDPALSESNVETHAHAAFRQRQARDVRTMMAMLRHRGPDGSGLFLDGPVALGHRLLAIQDVGAGHQPMTEASGRFTLTFNGEIYNFPELRRELIALGHRFRTRTDTEVLLHLYQEYGAACLDRLNGMYAFAIWDKREQTLFLARDRFGIKPLYFALLPDRLLFASEAKALLPLMPRIAHNPAALADYFTFQLCLEDKTFFEGIQRLEPATCLTIGMRGAPEVRRYWSPDFQIDDQLQSEAVTARIGWLLDDAVRLNLRGDVPVGAYLSGGLDSSSVVMMASEILRVPLPCFTGTFREGPAYDETPYARTVAHKAGARLYEEEGTPAQLETLMPEVAWSLDEPMAGPGVLPQYLVARRAAQQVKVVLGGQGGDEIFGGYARYLVAYLEECLRGAIFETHAGGPFVVTFESILPNLPLLKPYVPLLGQFWSQGLFEPVERRYLRLLQKFKRVGEYLTPALKESIQHFDPSAPMIRDFCHPSLGSLINKMTWVDQRHFLPALLQVEDRVSMAVSIESRVPLLDHRLVELMAKTPPTIKFSGGELKVLLKRAMAHLVPKDILDRKDKMGFPVPLNLWAAGPLKPFVGELLLGKEARARGFFSPAALEQAVANPASFDRDLWGLMAIELWAQAYLDGAAQRRFPDAEALALVEREETVRVGLD